MVVTALILSYPSCLFCLILRRWCWTVHLVAVLQCATSLQNPHAPFRPADPTRHERQARLPSAQRCRRHASMEELLPKDPSVCWMRLPSYWHTGRIQLVTCWNVTISDSTPCLSHPNRGYQHDFERNRLATGTPPEGLDHPIESCQANNGSCGW